jgi:7-cyano-7-deazaguanine synthase in queuosine biosynthesis
VTPVHPFHFFSGDRVLGMQPQSGEKREMHYYVNDDSVAKLLGATLSPILADLVDVAAAIHIADRLAVRQGKTPDSWRRRFRVDIPVRCLNDWRRPEVMESLCGVLAFLTGDVWDIRFSARPARLRTSESQTHLFPTDAGEPIRVSLFSGGLDALAGTIAHMEMEQKPDQHLVCVSGTPNNRQGHHQRIQVAWLRETSQRSITHIRVPCWLESGAEVSQEPTRRTRGIFFLILGAVSALSAGANQLFVYENGIGAINLPYERIPVGVPNSRSVHPSTLILVAQFVKAITGQPFFIENPAVFQTKAEMCKHRGVQRLGSVIGETFSCDGFPVQRSGTPQCGVCTSCILRRQALYGAGLKGLDVTGYGCDFFQNSQIVSPHRLRGLAAMDWQVVRLSDALQNGWVGLMREFPDLRQTCVALSLSSNESIETVQQRLVRLYTQHVEEWTVFRPRALLMAQRKAA